MSEDAIARVRRLLAAAKDNGTWIREYVALKDTILPAMCDVIDAAREVQAGLFPMDVPWEDGPMMLERLRKALAALDRAAEEGGEGGE